MASNGVHIKIHPVVCKLQHVDGYTEDTISPILRTLFIRTVQSAQYGFHRTFHKVKTLKTVCLHDVFEQ